MTEPARSASAPTKKRLKPIVFWPPFLLLLTAMAASFVDREAFDATLKVANAWVLAHFGSLFSITALVMLGVCIVIFVSPLGRMRIGGPKAVPLLSVWRWFSITLCSTVAIGILFWGTAEPLYHLTGPPKTLGIEAGSAEAASFALSTMYMHWTFTPYAIYSVPAVLFALAYYNTGTSYSLAGPLAPLMGRHIDGLPGQIIDSTCLYALVAGMAAALGAGMLSLAGGLEALFGVPNNPLTLGLIAAAVVSAFIVSAASGLQKGIRILSDINAKVFLGLALFVLVAGPTAYIIQSAGGAVTEYLSTFFDRSLLVMDSDPGDTWANDWTVFYWAVWMAWAPVTALFLGRIGYGYSVRAFMTMNLIAPAIFGCIWMSIFGGTSLHLEMFQDAPLAEALAERGPESIVYAVFAELPLDKITAFIFLATAFLSYVTAADSNTTAMASVSTAGITPDDPEPSVRIKVAWGLTVGLVAWVMTAFSGIDGVRMASNLGGVPALILMMLVSVAALRVVFKPSLVEKAPDVPASADERSDDPDEREPIRR